MEALAKFFICFFSFKLAETLIRRTAIVHNGWGLTKFCLLPNLKNMRKPKGKILFKPMLAAVAYDTVHTKRKKIK